MGMFFEKHIILVFEKLLVNRLQLLRLRNTGGGGVKIQGYVNTIFCSFT